MRRAAIALCVVAGLAGVGLASVAWLTAADPAADCNAARAALVLALDNQPARVFSCMQPRPILGGHVIVVLQRDGTATHQWTVTVMFGRVRNVER